MQQNIQIELNFSGSPAGEAREAGREEAESLSTMHAPERPAGTTRLMEEICDRESCHSLAGFG
jgi:RNA-directed DNA polymerase